MIRLNQAAQIGLRFLLLASCLFVVFWGTSGNRVKMNIYSLYRDVARTGSEWQTRDWESMEGERVILRYKDEDRDIAPYLLADAEASYGPVSQAVGQHPPAKPLVILHPDRASFNRAFGWDDEEAMGAYYLGVVRVLSPKAWKGGQFKAVNTSGNEGIAAKAADIQSGSNDQQKPELPPLGVKLPKDPSMKKLIDSWRRNGPMAHEMAHLLVDYRTGGNMSRWFTEGMAQWIELEITGYLLSDPRQGWSSRLYSWSELDDRFDSQPEQRLAYRQSLLAVQAMIDLGGKDAPFLVMDNLSKGMAHEQAVAEALHISWQDFCAKVQQFADEQDK